MDARQSRMARAALQWGIRELGKKASVAPSTISRFEAGEALQPRTLEAIQRDRFVGPPAAQLKRAGACGMSLEPLVAEIIGGSMRFHFLAVDERSDIRGQAAQDELR